MNIFALWVGIKAIKAVRNSPYSYHPELYPRMTAQEIEKSERPTTWRDWLASVLLALFFIGAGIIIGTIFFLLLYIFKG